MLERWTRAVIRFRLAVLAFWLAVGVLGAVSAGRLPALLSTALTVPGTNSDVANTTLAQHFGENPEGTFTVVFRTGSIPRGRVHALTRRVVHAARTLPGAHVTPLQATAGIVYGNVVTRLDLQRAQRYTDALRRALASSGRPAAYVTGEPALQHDLNPVLAADLSRGETVAVPIALLMLTLVLGLRMILVVPLLFAAGTITAALAIVFILAQVFPMVSYVPNLVELLGLGLAIDYSLLIVRRFREEAADETRSVDDVMVRTMATAGRAVFFSGAAVALGLSAVLIIPVPFIRSMGIAGVVVPVVSILGAFTIQPALLSLLGRGGLRGVRLPWDRTAENAEDRFWKALARTVMRRPAVVLAGALALLAVLAVPAFGLRLTPASISSVPQSTQSAQGVTLLRDHVGAGTITPIQVVVDAGAAGRARTAQASMVTLRLATRLLQDPEVLVVAIGPKAPYMDATGRYRRVIVVARHELGDEPTQQLVRLLRGRYIPATRFPAGMQVSSGGAPAQGVDFLDRVYGTFPWVVLAVLLLAYFVLLRAFRSVLLPLMAVLLDLISVAAAYGLLVLVFQDGIGARLLGLYRAPQIEGWVPVFLFVTLFGLSMDYEVFLVTRMREAWDRGAGNGAAVSEGLERTGRIVTAAAVIMVAAFSGFIAGRVAGLQEFGTGLALGVLLDATVVRMLLLPSLMTLLGRWNWWLPKPVARLAGARAGSVRIHT